MTSSYIVHTEFIPCSYLIHTLIISGLYLIQTPLIHKKNQNMNNTHIKIYLNNVPKHAFSTEVNNDFFKNILTLISCSYVNRSLLACYVLVHTLVIPWSYLSHILVIPWSYLGHTLVLPWSYLGHTLVIPWPYLGNALVIPRSNLGPLMHTS